MDTLAKLLATGFGAGYSPVAPGTCGTVVAVPLAWAAATRPHWQFVLLALAVTGLGIAVAERAGRAWGNTEDDQRIVIDEIAGYLITVSCVPRGWAALAIGFVVFRAFDIVKPWPVRWLDANLPGGWGVVLDDAAAGVMGAGVMLGLHYIGAFAALHDLL